MSTNLLTMARLAMGESMALRLAPVLESSPENTTKAIDALLPALLAAIGGRGDSLNGAGALLSFTDQPRIDGEWFAGLPQLLDEPAGRLLALAELGKDLLLALFGEKAIVLTHALARLSSMSSEAAGRLLGIVAALLLSMLKAEVKRLDLGAAGLQSLLAEQQNELLLHVDGGLSDALALNAVHAKPAPPVQLPVEPHRRVVQPGTRASRPMPAKLSAASGFSWPHWLSWVLGTMAVLWGVSLWLGRGSADHEDRTTAAQSATGQGTGYPAPVRIYFDSGKYETPDDTSRLLANIIEFSRVNTSSRLLVTAFLDGAGDPAVNAKLGKSRAMAIRSVLITGGITEDRISVDNAMPVANVADASAARRVDIAIAR